MRLIKILKKPQLLWYFIFHRVFAFRITENQEPLFCEILFRTFRAPRTLSRTCLLWFYGKSYSLERVLAASLTETYIRQNLFSYGLSPTDKKFWRGNSSAYSLDFQTIFYFKILRSVATGTGFKLFSCIFLWRRTNQCFTQYSPRLERSSYGGKHDLKIRRVFIFHFVLRTNTPIESLEIFWATNTRQLITISAKTTSPERPIT